MENTFPSLGTFLRHLTTTRQGETWFRYANSSSLDSWATLPSLTETMQQATSLQGLEPVIANIQAASAALQAQIQAPQTLRRAPVAHRSRGVLNIHRVLRGSSKPYQTRTPIIVPAYGRILTLVVPGSFHALVTDTQILYSNVATMALADLLQDAGYHVTVRILTVSRGLFQYQVGQSPEPSTSTWVTLRDPSHAWSIQAAAIIAQPTFLRRLMFRYWESLTPQYGPLTSYYGSAVSDKTQFAAFAGSDRSLVLGAGPWDNLQTLAQARDWVRATLNTLT